ncbi:MAG: hypothetical protein ACRDSJ_09610, partial [Rubrobacteraceae bacterium]
MRSGSKLRRCYTVGGSGFECDCPEARRRHAACKHAIACWLLEGALRRPLRPRGLEGRGMIRSLMAGDSRIMRTEETQLPEGRRLDPRGGGPEILLRRPDGWP